MFEFLEKESESMQALYRRVIDRHFMPAITDDDLQPNAHVRTVRAWIEEEGKKQAKEAERNAD